MAPAIRAGSGGGDRAGVSEETRAVRADYEPAPPAPAVHSNPPTCPAVSRFSKAGRTVCAFRTSARRAWSRCSIWSRESAFLTSARPPETRPPRRSKRTLLAVACDSHLGKLRNLLAEGARRVQIDATRPFPFPPVFDRILVDAPCSGTGTLGRNPEIKWRLHPEDLARFAGKQAAILSQALKCLKPGGLLVYSTCSLEPEENESVVRAVPAGKARQRSAPDCRDASPGMAFTRL